MRIAALLALAVAAILLVLLAARARRRRLQAGSPFVINAARLPRPRHLTAPWVMVVLFPVVHYSSVRGAYILRLVGNQYGPVFVTRPPAERLPPRPAVREPSHARRP